MSCPEHLEALSALVDGETSPEETRELQEHLTGCASCRATFEAMTGLFDALPAPPEKLPSDFARQTARFVRARSTPPLPPTGGGLGYLRRLWSHPVRNLAVPLRRRTRPLGGRDAFKLLGLFGLPVLFMSMLRDSMPLGIFLGVTALAVMVGVPLRHFSGEVALLGSLRRGRCLEEILGAGIEPEGLVDALATQGLGELLKACAAVTPALALGTLAMPAEDRMLASTDFCLWLPATLAVFVAGSYATQFLLAWSGLASTLILGTLGGLALPLGLELSHLEAGQSPAVRMLGGAAGAFVLALVLGWGCRQLTLWGLRHPEKLEHWNERGILGWARRRAHRLPHFSSNPIARRELSRVSGTVPHGRLGLFVWRASNVVLPLLWAGWTLSALSAGTTPAGWSNRFWGGVALFALLVFWRSAQRTLPAITRERESRSWETLLQTHLDLPTFAAGWVQVSTYTVLVESVFGIFTLLLFGLLAPAWLTEDGSVADGWRFALLAGCALMLSNIVGALTGLALSSVSATTRSAGSRLVSLGLKALGMWLVAWAVQAVAFLPVLGLQPGPEAEHLWTDLLLHGLPLSSWVLVCLGLWVWSWRTLRRCFGQGEAEPAETRKAGGNYPASLLPLELAAPGFVGYAFLSLVLMTGGLDSSASSVTPFVSSFGLLVMLMIWAGVVRLPLATLAELGRGKRRSLVLGLANGLALGSSGPLLATSVHFGYASRMFAGSSYTEEFVRPITPDTGAWISSLAVGAVLGLACGWWSSREEGPREERREALGRRLRLSLPLSGVALSALALLTGQGMSLKLDYPEQVQRSLEHTAARRRAVATLAPERNGFTLLRPWLMARDTHMASAITGKTALGSLYSDQSMELGSGKLAERARVTRALFEKEVLPTVQAALARPELMMTPPVRSFSDLVPNYILLRRVEYCLAGLGWLHERAGENREALQSYALGLRWACFDSGNGMLIGGMIDVAMLNIATRRVFWFLGHHTLTAAQAHQLVATIDALPIRPEHFEQLIEMEEAMGWDLLLPTSDPRKVTPEHGLPLPAFCLRYERNALANSYGPMLVQARELQARPFQLSLLQGQGETNGLGTLTSLTRSITPNAGRAGLQWMTTLTHLQAIRTIALLQEYRAEHGEYPQRLGALGGVCWNAADRQFLYTRVGDSFRLEAPRITYSNGARPSLTEIYYPRTEDKD